MTVVADNGGMPDELQTARKPKARELNELIGYTMWSVFRVRDGAAPAAAAPATGPGLAAGEMTAELVALLEQAAGKGTITRGCYDVQGLRADADFMFWWIAVRPSSMTCRN